MPDHPCAFCATTELRGKLHAFKQGLRVVQQQHQRHFDETPPRYIRSQASLTEYTLLHYDEQQVTLVLHPLLPAIIAHDTHALFQQIFGDESY